MDTNKRLEKRFKDREDEYITYRQFHILVGTFNVNNRQAPNNQLLEEWLHRQNDQNDRKVNTFPDIVAVGFQEIDTGGGAYFIDDKKKEDEWGKGRAKNDTKSFTPGLEAFELKENELNSNKIIVIFKFTDISCKNRGSSRCCSFKGNCT